MTVPAATSVRTTPADADGANVLWDFGAKFSSRTQIRLFLYDGDDVETEITSDLFDVSAPGLGGTVTYPLGDNDPLEAPTRVVVERTVALSQPNRIGNQGGFQPQTHEDTFDLLEMQIQQVGARLSRVFYVPDIPASDVVDYRLPELLAGYALVWSDDGLVNSSVSIEALASAGINAEAAAELALGYAALAVNALQTMMEAAVIVANGGLVNSALLITYSGDWAAVNVAAALDEAKAAVDDNTADVAALQSAVTTLQGQVAALLASGVGVPIGGSIVWLHGTLPPGFALMFGQSVGDTGSGADLVGPEYEALFDALEETLPNDGSEVFGSGDTRVIPDMRGRAFIGRDDMGGAAASRVTNSGAGNPGINGTVRGASGGVDRHALTVSQLPAHGHPFRVSLNVATSAQVTGGLMLSTSVVSNKDAFDGEPTSTAGEQIGGTGSDAAHKNVQPSMVGDWIICTGVI